MQNQWQIVPRSLGIIFHTLLHTKLQDITHFSYYSSSSFPNSQENKAGLRFINKQRTTVSAAASGCKLDLVFHCHAHNRG